MAYALIQAGMQSTKNYFADKSLWLYVPLLALFVYLFFDIMSFRAEHTPISIIGALYTVEFGVHELSHIVMASFPSIVHLSAGAVGEIAFTIVIAVVAIKQRSYFAAIFGFLWVMLAFNSEGRYMADARTMLLPTIGPGGTGGNDWNYVFSQVGWLSYDKEIGAAMIIIGDVIGAVALLVGAYIVIRIGMQKLIKT